MIYELLMKSIYVCIGFIIGFFIAMYLSWRYEKIREDEIRKHGGLR